MSALRSLALALAFAATGAMADIDGHGPDAWQVVGVASGDVLNARMGPGTQYQVIDRFAPGERGLQQVTCVPLVPMALFMDMSEAARAALPARWCLMRSADLTRAGWVNGAYLEEDGATPIDAPAAKPASVGDPVVDLSLAGSDSDLRMAMEVVRDLYAAFASARTIEDNPFYGMAPLYFSGWIAGRLEGHGGDVLYDAQDFDGRILRIYPDAAQPNIQGFMTVHVDLVNFGRESTVTFNLRRDDAQIGNPVRIIRVVHPGWTFE
ncbi:MAG: hypothetical protein H3C51_06560 [Rubellimicrobium sp.]|nr:hypothetical protein [Rubellimicrobium sp.]